MVFQYLCSFDNFIDINDIVQFIFGQINKRWDVSPLISTETMADLQSSTHQDLCALQLQYNLESHGLDFDVKLLSDVLSENDYDIEKSYHAIISQKLKTTFAQIVKSQEEVHEPKKTSKENKVLQTEINNKIGCSLPSGWAVVQKNHKVSMTNEYSSMQTAQYDQEYSLRIKANTDFHRMKDCFKTAAILQRCSNCYFQSQDAIRKGREFQCSMIQANAQAAYHAIR